MPSGSTLHVLEEYSFSHEAALDVVKQNPDVTIVCHETIEQVLGALGDTHAYAQLPLENSSSGAVHRHLDYLLAHPELSIAYDIPWKVRMCIGGVHGATLAGARTVCSHPQATTQSKDYLAQHPQITVIQQEDGKPYGSTSGAARSVRNSQDPTRLALASPLAFKSLGMDILDWDVSKLKGYLNQTSMAGIHANGTKSLPAEENRYHALDLTIENEPGVLWNILQVIARARVDLTSLHSRKAQDENQYRFFVEMDREGSPDRFALMTDALAAMKGIASRRWLGSWNMRYGADENGKAPNCTDRERGQIDIPRTLEAAEYTLDITPRNTLGILSKILGTLADAGTDLTDLHSRTIGPKEYAFQMTMRSTDPKRFARMVRILQDDEDILAMHWEAKKDAA